MNPTVAFKAEFDAQFPDLSEIGKDEDRIPGRPVAEMIMRGLRERAIKASDVTNQEPFFEVTCEIGDYKYVVLTSIAGGDGNDPVWQINCGRIFGFWELFPGKNGDSELANLLEAVHDILKRDSRVKEIRWFHEPQIEPWLEKQFSSAPR
jgi:hypothetical protein